MIGILFKILFKVLIVEIFKFKFNLFLFNLMILLLVILSVLLIRLIFFNFKYFLVILKIIDFFLI